jgi:hypothetical protein
MNHHVLFRRLHAALLSAGITTGAFLTAAAPGTVTVTEANTTEGIACFKIETPGATYWLDRAGGALTSLVDLDGIDWVKYSSAKGLDGQYRGLPNTSYRDGLHPGNTGFAATTTAPLGVPQTVVTVTVGKPRADAATYHFHPTHVEIILTAIEGQTAWILYEGTPGGADDDQDHYRLSDGRSFTGAENHLGDVAPHPHIAPDSEWMAVTASEVPRTLFLAHDDDNVTDRFTNYPGMCMWGFGRDRRNHEVLTSAQLPNRMVLGMVESTDATVVDRAIARAWATPTRGARPPLPDKPRVIVETDLGGDRDDQESFIRLMLHSHELEILAIICDRPEPQLLSAIDDNAQNPDRAVATNGVNMAHYYIDHGYAPVAVNLQLHDPAYPTPGKVHSWIVAGYPGTLTGRDRIIAEVDALTNGQIVWYMNWGSNTVEALPGKTTLESNLKLALDLVLAERGEEGLRRFLRKLRLVSLDGNSNRHGHLNTRLGDALNAIVREESMHIETGWPAMDGGRWYHRFRPLTQNAGGFDRALDLSDEHGPLARLYRDLGQKEGDSWCFVYLLPFGIGDPHQPTWGGMAGRYGPRGLDPAGTPTSAQGAPFYWNDQRDTWAGSTSRDHTAGRFAAALQNAFRARLDWCTAPFAAANHDPVPAVTVNGRTAIRGTLRLKAAPGETLVLQATPNDPDEGDQHRFQWHSYPEAGTYAGLLEFKEPAASETRVVIPPDAAGKQIHLYVEVTDNGSRKGNRVPDLTRYCRIVVDVATMIPPTS